jgi:hypothetical protein
MQNGKCRMESGKWKMENLRKSIGILRQAQGCDKAQEYPSTPFILPQTQGPIAPRLRSGTESFFKLVNLGSARLKTILRQAQEDAFDELKRTLPFRQAQGHDKLRRTHSTLRPSYLGSHRSRQPFTYNP